MLLLVRIISCLMTYLWLIVQEMVMFFSRMFCLPTHQCSLLSTLLSKTALALKIIQQSQTLPLAEFQDTGVGHFTPAQPHPRAVCGRPSLPKLGEAARAALTTGPLCRELIAGWWCTNYPFCRDDGHLFPHATRISYSLS